MQPIPFLETLPFSVILALTRHPAASHGLACPGFDLSCCYYTKPGKHEI